MSDIAATVAATLRVAATWITGDEDRATLFETAEQVERDPGPDSMSCPLCEEITCDDGCPMEPVRQRVVEPGGGAGLLTGAEHRAMALTVELVNLLAGEVIADGPARRGDVNEVVHAIHLIQRMVLGQAAARAYPDRYRLLGGHPPGRLNPGAETGRPPTNPQAGEPT